KPFNRAISMERRPLFVPDKAGAGSVYSNLESGASYDVDNLQPNEIFGGQKIIALLKVDCKGCEKELFDESIDKVSKKVKFLIIDAGRLTTQEREKMIARLVSAGFSEDTGPSEALYFRN